MSLLSALSIVCGLMLHVSLSALNTHYCVPRKTVPYQSKSHTVSTSVSHCECVSSKYHKLTNKDYSCNCLEFVLVGKPIFNFNELNF